ncbi:hypothetical protein DFJ73DRAFT_217873 [Zopfochytrium polystomum]|nr:hypothetical protein DFJ73DRAFT_217873 [Zopfochytrium polystomum]
MAGGNKRNSTATNGTSTTEPHRRRARVLIGTTVDDCTIPIAVNDDARPVFIDGPHFSFNIVVRVRNFDGHTPEGDATEPIANGEYWGAVDKARNYSIQVQGRFKRDHTGDDILYGNFFERAVYHPPLISIPLKLATFIDPTFTHDLLSDRPWAYSPAVSSSSVLCVREPPAGAKPAGTSGNCPSELFGEWEWKDGRSLDEDHALLYKGLGKELMPKPGHDQEDSVDHRRKHVKNKTVRSAITWSKDLEYNFEFYAPFLNLNRMELNMAGITVGLERYLNNQPFYFGMKCNSLDTTLFCVKFEMV